MFSFRNALVFLGILCLIRARLLKTSSCTNGVVYEGFCFDECPSGFHIRGENCRPQNINFFMLDSLAPEDNVKVFGSDLTEQNPEDFPIFTSSQGYYFKNSSKVLFSGPKVFSYKMTIEIYLLMLRKGEIISGSNQGLRFFSKTLDRFSRLDYNILGKWNQLHIEIEYLLEKTVNFKLKFGKIQYFESVLLDEFPDLDKAIWVLGDFSGNQSGFVGFIHKAEFFNYLREPSEVLILEDCIGNYEKWENCDSRECFDSLCEVRHRRAQITCNDPACSTCSSEAVGFCTQCAGYVVEGFCFSGCPLMFSDGGSSVCTKDSTVLHINFETSTGISANPNKFAISNTGNTAIYVPLKGYYFNSTSNYFSTTDFYLFPFYSIQIWISVISGNEFSVTFGQTGLKVISSTIYNSLGGTSSLLQLSSGWNFYQFLQYSEKFENKESITNLQSYSPYTLKITRDNILLKLNTTILSQYDGDFYSIMSNTTKNNFYITTGASSSIMLLDIRYAPFFTTFASESLNTICNSGTISCTFCNIGQFKYKTNCQNGNSGCYNCFTSTLCTVNQTNYCYKLLNFCYNPCPLYYIASYFKCHLESVNTMVFKLNTLNGTVTDSIKYSMTLDTALKQFYAGILSITVPIPSKNRGFYFGKSGATPMLTSQKFIFSPEFFLGIWAYPVLYADIAQKTSVLNLNITSTGIGVTLTNITNTKYDVKGTTVVALNKWHFIAISLSYNNLGSTIIDIYVNSVKQTFTVASKILMDSTNNLKIGSGNLNFFIGWIYKVIYSARFWTQTEIGSEIGTCTECNCPSSLNSCIPTCNYNEFYSLDQCRKCTSNTVCNLIGIYSLCFDKNDCTQCNDYSTTCKVCAVSTCKTTCHQVCQTCSSPSMMNCETCANSYYSYFDVCIPYCPDLTTLVGSNCTLTSTVSLKYTFYSSASTITDSLNKVVFESSNKVFYQYRGWFTSQVTSQQKFTLSPYPSFLIWIKLSTFGQIYSKVTSSGDIDFKLNLNTDSTFDIIQYTSLGLITNSNIAVSGLSPFSWKFISIIYESGNTMSKSYFNVDTTLIKIFQLNEQYIISNENALFQIGNNSPFLLYSFTYYSNLAPNDFYTTYNSKTGCIYPIDFNTCLWECPLTQYYDGINCKDCYISSSCRGENYLTFVTCYTYLNGYCTNLCPTLYTNISSICTLGSENSLDFHFDSISATIPSTNGLMTFTNPSSNSYPNQLTTDPLPGFKRGFYFINSSILKLTENFALSNDFTVELWYYFIKSWNFIIRSNFKIGTYSGQVTVLYTLTNKISYEKTLNGNFLVNQWNYLAIMITKDRITQLYSNTNNLGAYDMGNNFLDVSEIFKLGGQSGLKGWIYRFKYTAKALQSSELIVNTESAPVLWNCDYGYYYESSSCVACTGLCNCRRSADCTLCQAENCKVCTSYTSTCSQCFDGYEYFVDVDECRICSPRCSNCKYYLDECTVCKTEFVNNDNSCMVYCSNGDVLTNGQCVHTDLNIVSFVFNKVNLPFASNEFELKLGTESKFWPNYDLSDPWILSQRGFYFSDSLLEMISTTGLKYLQLSNKQTFEIYFFSMLDQGSLISFYAGSTVMISVNLSGTTMKIAILTTNTLKSTELFIESTFELYSWIRLTWTLETSSHEIRLKAYFGASLIQTVSASNSIFDQQQNTKLFLGSFNNANFFKGYIYSFSIDNYVRNLQSDFLGCTCAFCTVSGDCLVNCGPLEYMNTTTCKNCLAQCTYGCGQGITCSIFKDELCSSFNYLDQNCENCLPGTKFNKKPCECVDTGYHNLQDSQCRCSNGQFVYENNPNISCEICNKAKTCTGFLYSDYLTCFTYLNGVCTEICPTLLTNISSVCTLGSENNLDFLFDSFNGAVSSTNGLLTLNNPSSSTYPNFLDSDPKPGFRRGFYFLNSWFESNQNLVFSNQFSLEVWVNFYSLGLIISKSKFELGLGSSAITIKLILEDNIIFNHVQQASIFLYGWNYVGVALTPERKVQIYLKNILLASVNLNGHFLDGVETLKLGGQETQSFKGWIYRLKYTAKHLLSNELIINTESNPILWNCFYGYYNEANSCLSCKNECNCRRSTDCTLCQQDNCLICSGYTSSCDQCSDGYEYIPVLFECKYCSTRCVNCKYYLDECTNCKTEFVKNYDNTCMIYCSKGDLLTNSKCVHTDSNIMSFIFNKVLLPFESNNFELKLGIENKYWPDYDQSDPIVMNQRGFYFSKSLLEVITNSSPGYLELSNTQTVEIYFFAMQDVGTILSFYSETEKIISVFLSGNTVNIVYLVTDTLKSYQLSASFAIQLNKWVRLTSTLETLNHQIQLVLYNGPILANSISLPNSVFTQLSSLTLMIGSYKKFDNFKGYIYSFSIDNYARPIQNDYPACNCPYCTVSGDCLLNCGPQEYMNKTCQKCPKNCKYGCGQGLTCSVFHDPLCESFNSLEGPCLTCISSAKSEIRPCECIDSAVFNPITNICECSGDTLLYQGKCDQCYRYLKSNEITSYFLSNFIQLFLNFTIQIVQVNCDNLFDTSTLVKFGKGYFCEYGKDDKTLIVTMGSGFTLLDEKIKLNLFNVKGLKKECGNPFQDFDVKVNYSIDPPVPVAIIKSNNPIDINCQDLNIDGSQSTGQLLTGLLYKWEFVSTIPELRDYPKELTSNSYFQLDRSKLKSEVLNVTLTVYNRFELQGSSSLLLQLTDKSSLLVEFDKTVDYSCSISKTCQFFIKNVRTCVQNPVFLYTWKLNNEGLTINNGKLDEFLAIKLNFDNIIIPANVFNYSELEFSVTVRDQISNQFGSSTLIILVKPDTLNILFSKASGSISDKIDLILAPSISATAISNTKINFEWSCFLDNKPCNFPYNKNFQTLTISKNYLRLRLVNKLILTVISTTNIQGKTNNYEIVEKATGEFICDIVSESVPNVNIFESKSMSQPKILSGQTSKIFLAELEDSDYKSYSFKWKIDNVDNSVFTSPTNQVTTEVDMLKLIPGSSYKLSIELSDKEKNIYNFNYDFTVNKPPVYGICSVQPESGEELTTLFIVSCADWESADGNYPLTYSFGFYIEQEPIYKVLEKETPYFSTTFTYTSSKLSIFSRITDSLKDYTEFSNTISLSIKNSFDAESYLNNAAEILETSLTSALPNQLLDLALAVLNRDVFTQSEFKKPTNETLESMNSCFNLITNKLDLLLNNSLPSSELIDQVSGILQEVTKNPFLVSDENFESTSNLILNLLEQTKNIALSVSQVNNLLSSVSNSIEIEASTLYEKPEKIKTLENLFLTLSDGLTKSTVPNQIASASSGNFSLNLMKFDKTSVSKEIFMDVGSLKSVLPSELFSSYTDLSKIAVFAGQIGSNIANNSSSPTATIISIYSIENSEIIPAQLKTSLVSINIQVHNTKLIKKPACFYLNSTNQWDQSGCTVLEVGEDNIICGCSHLSLFSSGEGVEGGGFVPSSNIEQTANIDALLNINAKSAIGFYFVAVIMAIYSFIGIIAWNKDSRDLRELINELDAINARQILGNASNDIEENESQNSLVNDAQIINVVDITPRLVRNFTLRAEDIKKQNKTGFNVIIQEHRLLNIFFHRDPETFRFTRCSLLFLIFIGKMYFIGLFYEDDAKNSKINSAKDVVLEYTLRDLLVMIYSIGIVIALDFLLVYLTKIKIIDLNWPREIVLKNIRFNKVKRIISLLFCWGIMAFYCWSIAMFALSLEYSVSLKWVLNTAFGIFTDLTVTPFIKLIIKGFIIAKLILYFKLRKISREILPSEQKSDEENGLTK